MSRLMIVLILAVTASALAVVSTQHRSRRLVTELEREQAHTRALQEEFTRLDIEQQAVAALPTVERVARVALRMDQPAKGAQISLEAGSEARR